MDKNDKIQYRWVLTTIQTQFNISIYILTFLIYLKMYNLYEITMQ